MDSQHHRSSSGVKKRASNACARCRQQKIKCSGQLPCTSCSKRDLPCTFDDSTRKILVSSGYLQSLQRQAESHSFVQQNTAQLQDVNYQSQWQSSNEPIGQSEVHPDGTPLTPDHVEEAPMQEQQPDHPHDNPTFSRLQETSGGIHAANNSSISSPGADLVNPLAIDSGNYMTDFLGRHIHLGTSSNWSFGRRVLSTACQRLNVHIPSEQLYFEGCAYNIDWNAFTPHTGSEMQDLLPSAEYAIYLINAIKFHCGQMFHLFDEETFMQHFAVFHETESGKDNVPRLWYGHYLLLIGLAKLLVARNTASRPPGAELFTSAMQLCWADLFFAVNNDGMESVETLVCAALYLQCLDFRNAAFKLIGQAVRSALEQGMHTQISSRAPDHPFVQRCRRIWWTVYVLDRQMSALMGLPQSIRDDDVSAPLPQYPSSTKNVGLELHVTLSRITADIVNTVYSTEGRLPRKFLASTKKALQSIAEVTELLAHHFEMPKNPARGGLSRFGAYLHLLNHQCICLTTRPLAFSFLDRRLQNHPRHSNKVILRGSAQVLLRMCVDSAQQMIQILAALKNEGLLESFLPFDLEAVFIAAMILVMAKIIDTRLLEDETFWTEAAYTILDDMIARGNMVAVVRKRELRHLTEVLKHAKPPLGSLSVQRSGDFDETPITSETLVNDNGLVPDMNENFINDSFWNEEMTADQLLGIADALDLDGFDWMTTSLDGAST